MSYVSVCADGQPRIERLYAKVSSTFLPTKGKMLVKRQRINRAKKIHPAILGITISLCAVLMGVDCKKIPESEFVGQKNKGAKVEVQPLPKTDNPTMNPVTAELELTPSSTAEVEMALMATTAETEILGEESGFVKRRSILFELKDGELKEMRILRPGEQVRVLQEVMLRTKKHEIKSFTIRDHDGLEGYVFKENLCNRRVCIELERWGVIETYDPNYMENRKVPQIKLKFFNLQESFLRELHVRAVFSYHGENIGEDSAYPVSASLGMRPLKPGEAASVFLRPLYNVEENDRLSPENPIEVEVKCSVGYGKYEKCGEYKIDQMHY